MAKTDDTADVRDFGSNVGAKNHDDTPALQAAVNAVGDTAVIRPGVIAIPVPVTLKGTVILDRKAVRLQGEGHGNVQQWTGSVLYWQGQAGVPVLRFSNCWGAGASNLRIVGNSAAQPSAAISLYQAPGIQSPSHCNSFSNIYIGHWFGYDGDVDQQFRAGIVYEGQDANNELCPWRNTQIVGCGIGIDVQGTQATLNDWWVTYLFRCGVGVRSATPIGFTVLNCELCGTDLQTVGPGLAAIRVTRFHSEGAQRLADLTPAPNEPGLSIEHGLWQLSDRLHPDGRIINGSGSTGMMRVSLRDMLFTDGGYTRSQVPTLDFTHQNASSRFIELEGIEGLGPQNILLSSVDHPISHGYAKCESRTMQWRYKLGEGQGYNFSFNPVNGHGY